MNLNLNAIVTGMKNGPEAIQQNFDKVTNEMNRMQGSVVTIPKEQFTKINGTISMDQNACKCTIVKFDNFAIMQISTYVGITAKAWTYREVASVPKSYFDGYSKFVQLGNPNRVDDNNIHYDNDFNLTNGAIAINTRFNEWNNKGVNLDVCGILYN